MDPEKPSGVELVQVSTELSLPLKPLPKVRLTAEEAIPHRPVEVVTEQDQRLEDQARPKAEVPTDFFKRAPIIEPPLAPGIAVNLESLLGFLDAMEKILPPESNYPLLSSAKVWYPPGSDEGTPRLYVEAGSHSVWTTVALKGESSTPKGFTAVMPVRRAKNILKSLRDDYPKVVVGIDEQHGVCLGPHTVPFGGVLDDFPTRPVMKDWVARAAMPAFYFREVCSRVLLAKSDDFREMALQGALFDFEFVDVDGVGHPLCTVVATDGNRIHVLRLPQMMIEVKPTRIRALPPTCTVATGFFEYMKEIVQNEWAALEFSGDQIVAKGEDFVVVARAPAEGRSSLHELAGWRRFNVDWPGYWLVSRQKLEQLALSACLGGTAEACRLRIDGIRETLSISSANDLGDKYSEAIPARSFNGAPLVNVLINLRFLRDALSATTGGLVRLAFDRHVDTQETSPIVIRGEDEQFKAIVMPMMTPTEGAT